MLNISYSSSIKSFACAHAADIAVAVKRSAGLQGEEKIQAIFQALQHIVFSEEKIATGFGHAIRTIIYLSEIYLSLGGPIEGIAFGIRKVVYMLACTDMRLFIQGSYQLKISDTLIKSEELHLPLYKVPYKAEHFTIENNILKLATPHGERLLSSPTGKCPAIGVVVAGDKKSEIISYLIEQIAASYRN